MNGSITKVSNHEIQWDESGSEAEGDEEGIVYYGDIEVDMEHIGEYKEYMDAMLKEAKAVLSEKVKARDKITMADVVARSQMQHKIKLLLQHKEKLKRMLEDFRIKEAVKGDDVTNDMCGGPLQLLLTQVEVQKIVVGMFKMVADKGDSKFQSIYKQDNNFISSIEDLEYNLTICKRHVDAIENLCVSDS